MTETTDTPAKETGATTSPMRKQPPHKQENWNGYSLEEIRYQRAYTLARLEINSSRLKQNASTFIDGSPSGSRSILGRMLSTFSYVDMALIVWKIGSRIWDARRIFRR